MLFPIAKVLLYLHTILERQNTTEYKIYLHEMKVITENTQHYRLILHSLNTIAQRMEIMCGTHK